MTINVLLSYAWHSERDLADVRQRLRCGRILIDSGAFTAHQKGSEIDLIAYAEYLDTWHGKWDNAITLDVIGNPAASRKNTQYLHGRGLRVMPVFTRGEKLVEFDAMVKDSGYVCVGGGIGMSIASVLARITALQRRAADLGGGIHALGMGAINHLRQARPFSGDSSNASGTFQYGRIRCFNGRMIKSIVVSDKPKIRRYWQLLRDHGVDVSILGNNGRVPIGKEYRLMQACNHLADTCADEWLRSFITVPPALPGQAPGPHVYAAFGFGDTIGIALDLDHDLHAGYNPPIWQIHGRRHHCPAMHAGAA